MSGHTILLLGMTTGQFPDHMVFAGALAVGFALAILIGSIVMAVSGIYMWAMHCFRPHRVKRTASTGIR